MFVDEALIEVTAGKGGDGSAHFRREKFIPRGGPDGGDGGGGGHVLLRVKDNMHGLAGVAGARIFQAENGENGRGKNQYGSKGESITIDVPPGTLVYERTVDGEQLALDTAFLTDETYRIAKGGRGGLGNVHFATSTNQAPRQFTPGTPGEHKTLRLEVRHIADVGLVGLPNVGKSTFLARVSQAKPKIADYPFTTLEPNLGVVEIGKTRFVIADIPGLIEGAAEGKGLGDKFLQHLSRTKVLLHLVDAQSQDPLQDYKTIRAELAAYDPAFVNKPEIVAISRIDTIDDKARAKLLKSLSKTVGHSIHVLSSQSGMGVKELLGTLSRTISKIVI